MKVMLVFDTDYGSDPQADLGDAFWLIESPSNRALALRAWQSGSTDSNSAVFDPPPGALTSEDVAGRLEDVELHHPEWSVIEVIGVESTLPLRAAMSEVGHKMTSKSGCISIQR